MAWLEGWAHRVPVAVDNSTPSATQNVSIYLPEDFGHFWSTIDASGDELRVTEADGITLATYDLDGFNKTNKAGTIRVGSFTADGTDSGVVLAWLYYGNAGAAGAAGAPATTSPVDGWIHLGRPKNIVGGQPVQPGASRPRARMQKTVGERIYVWFEVRGLLEKRQRANAGFLWEEVQRVVSTISTGGSAQASMVEAASTRFVEVSRARGNLRAGFYVGIIVKAGSDQTNYTLEPVIKTYAPEVAVDGGALVQGQYRTLEPRALLRVEDIDED